MTDPREYGLKHEFWRIGQEDSVKWSLALSGIGILQAAVGSGKSAIIRAVASQKSVYALARTRNLQNTVYKEHGFDIVMGRNAYPCSHLYAEEGDTAQSCIYEHEGMSRCPSSEECEYLIAKNKAKRGGKASLSYAYFLTAGWCKSDPAMCLACDEAHLLSDIVLGWTGCEITMKDVKEFYLSHPPVIEYTDGMSLFHRHDPCQQAIIYLRECIQSLNKQITSLSKHLKSNYNGPTVKRRLSRAQNLLSSLQATVKAIQSNAAEWYIVSGPGVIRSRVGPEPGFMAKPLTARYHFPSLFLHSPVTIAMSGTIGDPKTFAAELGIKDYQYRAVPSNFAPEVRPIQVLDVPHLNYRSTERDYEMQADAIAKAILECPKEWSGILHVTRKREGPLLADRLAHRGLQDRVWVTPDGATDTQMSAWVKHKEETNGKYGGQLCISWSMTEGVDLLDERICISAKIPFPDTSDPYEKARQNYSHSFYAQRSAWTLMQSLARTRRGFEDDYNMNGEKRQSVCIADGAWTRIEKYLDPDFLESIVYD
jgi:Rad3-related DNA helicase